MSYPTAITPYGTVTCIPREAVAKLTEPCALISITEHANRFVEIPDCVRWLLRLHFDDLIAADPNADIEALADELGLRLITTDQAEQIALFVRALTERRIVVNCEQGMSRSPAVAAAITHALGGDDSVFWEQRCPHKYTYRKVLEEGFWEDAPEREWARKLTIVEGEK